MQDTLKDTLRQLMTERLGALPDEQGSLGLDSFTLIELLEAIEQTLDIEIKAHELTPERFDSFESIALFLATKRSAP